ncbi:sugar transferase [Jeotgalibacillus campisalis]|uniref:Multidrug MFS transporter n=1 Tax=Jeotgalibacillus campisalis TaxID=220754 RepID=A0A0C2QYQ1_9BACL|nr:sugar transferase [Jeotgalibacillus campisalis]KIL43165.1 multidrug MFS transporter [Jeotgalibacillus campisalis]
MRNVEQHTIPFVQPSIQKELDSQQSYEKLKRFFDVVGATLGIIILIAIFAVIALIIKLEDPKGNIFFSQTRVGKDGREFKMYKFRSMVHDAEAQLEHLLKYNDVSGAMFKMKNDPRITKIGRFIRKTSIDELPQLFNVLKGDMSLVGPRPPLSKEVLVYTPHQKQRLLVMPGCTGLWQVSGRNKLGFDDMVKLDLNYISNRSILMDTKIIFKTVKCMVIPENSY